jgi:hypothetical protein
MLVEFLSDEQATRYGCYHADPSPKQMVRFFYLSPQDIRLLANYRRFHIKLGCAVQLCTLRFLGTFLPVLVLPSHFIDRAMLLGKCLYLRKLICRVLPAIFSRHPRVYGDSHNQE